MRQAIENDKVPFTDGTRFIKNYLACRLVCEDKIIVIAVNKFSPVSFAISQSALIDRIEHCMTAYKEVV